MQIYFQRKDGKNIVNSTGVVIDLYAYLNPSCKLPKIEGKEKYLVMSSTYMGPLEEAIRARLAELGYVESEAET